MSSDSSSSSQQSSSVTYNQDDPSIVYYVSNYELVKDEGNAGFDLIADEDRFIEVGTRPAPIKTNLFTSFHPTQVAIIKSRSGLSCKGLDIVELASKSLNVDENSKETTIGGGVIDSTYRGNWGIILDNARCTKDLENPEDSLSKKGLWVKKGDRIAQVIFLPIINVKPVRLNSVDQLPKSIRGERGFGSSGVKTALKEMTLSSVTV
jgi:dUTPase